ncbi:hypothetical protein AAE478_000230 [Parahypoxylon ruwenzoriense]
MICRRCLQRASALSSRIPQTRLANVSSPSVSPTTYLPYALPLRPFSSTPTHRYSSPSPSSAAPEPSPSGASTGSSGGEGQSPVLTTPLADAGEENPVLSTCPEGTVLTGINYFKNQTDPVALADHAYPAWLWTCLDVQDKAEEGAEDDAGDEFSKSKKQRKLAAKRQRAAEARMLAENNMEAFAPKIPLQHQTINLPSNEEGTTAGAIAAVAAREELRRAMRKERRAKIKETNYLKSM